MFDATPSVPPLPLQQSPEFRAALAAMGIGSERISLGPGDALLQSRILPVLGPVGLISRGPVWRDIPEAGAVRDDLARVGFPVLINAEARQDAVLRAAGLLRVMTPATLAVLDLRGGAAAIRARMHGKWRNRLVRAEGSALRFRRTTLPDARAAWVLEAEALQRRAQGYRGLPPTLALAFGQATPGAAVLYEALEDGAPVAGIVVLRHGAMATYFLGVTTQAGRAANAHTFLLARAAFECAAEGVLTLDLGTLDTQSAPGLARFKLGSGAQAVPLGGTWLYARALAGLLKPRRPWQPRGSP